MLPDNVLGDNSEAVDFGLVVTRILTQAGAYVAQLQWRHVRGQYGYNIYRAETSSDDPNDFYKINSKIIQVNFFEDRGFAGGVPMGNERITWYYKVIPVAQDMTELQLSRSLSATFSEPLSGVQKFAIPAIQMRTNLMLDPKAFSSAEPVHFFVRKWAGAYCDCVNIRTQEKDSNCPKCFSTGYIGGYSLIENVYCRVRSAKRQIIADAPGIMVSQLPTGTIGSYPRVSDGDIIVRAHNERYRIRNPKARKSQSFTTAQFFEMDSMQLYDMGYRLTAPPIVPPVDRIEGGNVLGGVLARSEGNAVTAGRGGEAVRPGQVTPEVTIADGETKQSSTTRTGTGVGRGYIGVLPNPYP